MSRDERVTNAERKFVAAGALSTLVVDGALNFPEYAAGVKLMRDGGADTHDIGYIMAYRALEGVNPELAIVVAETYMAQTPAYATELQSQIQNALVDHDFEKAARLREQLDDFRELSSDGISTILDAAAKGIGKLASGPKEE